jgi:hypothetical protein
MWMHIDKHIAMHMQFQKMSVTYELYEKFTGYWYEQVHNIPHQENRRQSAPAKGLTVFWRHHNIPYHQCLQGSCSRFMGGNL